MISVGILYDAQKLMGHVAASPASVGSLLESFPRLEVADFRIVLGLSQQCQWVEVNESGHLILSSFGKRICAFPDPAFQLRHQLKDILQLTNQSWAKKIADGRSEALKIMPEPVQQIFLEAGLLGEWSDELVEWWDTIGLAARSKRGGLNLETGRRAERLSIDFEEERTGQRPEWKCVDTNYAGYDLLSIIDRDDRRRCPIEVKGSRRRLTEATFVLTRREWDVAEANLSYRLHLWLIRDSQDSNRDLRVVAADKLALHVPDDCGEGKWMAVEVPFKPFWG